MKVITCAKRVVDANIKVRPKFDGSNVDIDHCKMSLNPFDEYAIEEAVRLKEAGIVTEIVVVSIGQEKCEETLRLALARGCDRAILVATEENYEPLNIAKILAAIYKKEQPALCILGKQAADDDASQVPQMLAGMLDLPQATFISKLLVDPQSNTIKVTREVDNGIERWQLSLPAIVSADSHLNEPRFIKLPAIMQAKKKVIHKTTIGELGLTINKRTNLCKVLDSEVHKNCEFFTSVTDLAQTINRLQSEQ